MKATCSNRSSPHEDEKNMIDLEHMKKVCEGSSEAFSALFRKYYDPLYQFAGRFVKDAQTAENMVQDVFVKIWSNREQLHVTTSVKSYLYTAVRNHALNYLKHQKKMAPIGDEDRYHNGHSRTPEETLIDKEFHEAVQAAIDKLPEKCREIYRLSRYDRLTYSEIAEILNISINTVKTQMKRALQALHKHLAYLMMLVMSLLN